MGLEARELFPIQATGRSIVGLTELTECVEQEKTQWCWAACIQMALARNGIHKGQCEVVKKAFPTFAAQGIDCCRDATGYCNQPCERSELVPSFKANGLVALEETVNALDLTWLRSAIGGRSLLVAVIWDGPSRRHMVLTIGVSASEDAVLVCDPERPFKLGIVTIDELKKPVGRNPGWEASWVAAV
jgi:hypothetical protein